MLEAFLINRGEVLESPKCARILRIAALGVFVCADADWIPTKHTAKSNALANKVKTVFLFVIFILLIVNTSINIGRVGIQITHLFINTA